MVQRSGESQRDHEEPQGQLSDEQLAEAQDVKESINADADTDDILKEIDEVLEVNAEEFVRGYIQKGGQ